MDIHFKFNIVYWSLVKYISYRLTSCSVRLSMIKDSKSNKQVMMLFFPCLSSDLFMHVSGMQAHVCELKCTHGCLHARHSFHMCIYISG